MASITVRNPDEELNWRLRVQAAANGRSMEQEAREIPRAALCEDEGSVDNPGTAMHELFGPLGGVELEIPAGETMRNPPRFD